jgi:hypothetical protein
MNTFGTYTRAAGRSMRLALAAWLILPPGIVTAAAPEKFDLLQIGTRTYTNVTVTSKAKNHIFIYHTGGITSLKIAELPLPIKQQLGYAPAGPGRIATNTAVVWAKQEFAKINVLSSKPTNQKPGWKSSWQPFAKNLFASKMIFVVLGIALVVYLFHCYCCMLICRKTGNPPGPLIWLPVLQLFPLLRAAGMSAWWFLGFCVPVVNFVAQVLWCLNIAKARGKSVWVGVLLLLPLTNLVMFLYLAFSDSDPVEEGEARGPRIMSLEAT